MDTNRVPQPRHDDDTVEAHYACLERPCACLEGWVFVGYIDDYGEEREASYACRRCNVGEMLYPRSGEACTHDLREVSGAGAGTDQ